MKKLTTLKIIGLMVLSSLATATFLYLIATPQQVEAYTSLVNRLKGKILLRVEHKGEAWYVNPDNGQRYFMGSPSAAFNLMKSLGLGITDADLMEIPLANGNYDEGSMNTFYGTNGLTFSYPVPWTLEAQSTSQLFIIETNHPVNAPFLSLEWKNQTIQQYVNEYNNSLPVGVAGIHQISTGFIGASIPSYLYQGENAMGNVDLILFEHNGWTYIIDKTGYSTINSLTPSIQAIFDSIHFS